MTEALAQTTTTSVDMDPDNPKDKREMQKIPYVNVVTKLLHVHIRLTRIDTLAVIAECARFMSNLDMEH